MSEEVKKEEVIQEQVQATQETVKEPTEEELRQAAIEEQAKKARVMQIIQYDNGTISVVPIQNLSYRSDIVGILIQALQTIQNEDIARKNASLLREAIAILQSQPNTPNVVNNTVQTESTEKKDTPEA